MLSVKGQIVRVVLICVSMSLLSSCSKSDLSRSDATKLIDQVVSKADPITLHLDVNGSCGIGFEKINSNEALTIIAFWQQKGLVDTWTINNYNGRSGRTKLACKLTSKSQKFVLKPNFAGYTVIIGKRKMQDVTGIKLNDAGTAAEVIFTHSAIPEGFGEAQAVFPESLRKEKLFSSANEGVALLALYDDGWRVENVKY